MSNRRQQRRREQIMTLLKVQCQDLAPHTNTNATRSRSCSRRRSRCRTTGHQQQQPMPHVVPRNAMREFPMRQFSRTQSARRSQCCHNSGHVTEPLWLSHWLIDSLIHWIVDSFAALSNCRHSWPSVWPGHALFAVGASWTSNLPSCQLGCQLLPRWPLTKLSSWLWVRECFKSGALQSKATSLWL